MTAIRGPRSAFEVVAWYDDGNTRKMWVQEDYAHQVGVLSEACGGHGKNGWESFLTSGSNGLMFRGLPWYWDKT